MAYIGMKPLGCLLYLVITLIGLAICFAIGWAAAAAVGVYYLGVSSFEELSAAFAFGLIAVFFGFVLCDSIGKGIVYSNRRLVHHCAMHRQKIGKDFVEDKGGYKVVTLGGMIWTCPCGSAPMFGGANPQCPRNLPRWGPDPYAEPKQPTHPVGKLMAALSNVIASIVVLTICAAGAICYGGVAIQLLTELFNFISSR